MAKKTVQAESYLRLFHIASHTPSIDLYIDEQKNATDILYEDFTPYHALTAGTHSIIITLKDDTETLYERKINLSPYKIYTLLLLNEPKHPDQCLIYLIEDVRRSIKANECMCRLGHFHLQVEPLELHLKVDEQEILKKVGTYEMTPYFPLAANTYLLELIEKYTQALALQKKDLLLKPERFYTLYIIENTEKEFAPQLILSIDGNSYIHPVRPKIDN